MNSGKIKMKRPEKEIYIIRHGETDYNRRKIIQGRGVNSSLNETGVLQAASFFKYFNHLGFEAIFTSTLNRTQETIKPFIEAGHSYQAFKELDEIDWGIYEGKIADTGLSKEYISITGKWKAGHLSEKIPGGESPLELQERQRKFIENHLMKSVAVRILICCHGRAMRSLLCTMTNTHLSKMDDFPHQNLSLYKLNYGNEIFEIDLFNYTAHVTSNGMPEKPAPEKD